MFLVEKERNRKRGREKERGGEEEKFRERGVEGGEIVREGRWRKCKKLKFTNQYLRKRMGERKRVRRGRREKKESKKERLGNRRELEKMHFSQYLA